MISFAVGTLFVAAQTRVAWELLNGLRVLLESPCLQQESMRARFHSPGDCYGSSASSCAEAGFVRDPNPSGQDK